MLISARRVSKQCHRLSRYREYGPGKSRPRVVPLCAGLLGKRPNVIFDGVFVHGQGKAPLSQVEPGLSRGAIPRHRSVGGCLGFDGGEVPLRGNRAHFVEERS